MAPHRATRFLERTAVERVYARLKEEVGGQTVRVRGAAKVMAHLMFGILALTVDQLLDWVRLRKGSRVDNTGSDQEGEVWASQ